MKYLTLIITLIVLSGSLSGQSYESFNISIDAWMERNEQFMDFYELSGSVEITRCEPLVYSEYTLENGCIISTEMDLSNKEFLISWPYFGTKISTKTNCETTNGEIILIANQVFSLDRSELRDNRSLEPNDKLFIIGNHITKQYNKGIEIQGLMTLKNQKIKSLRAKFLKHWPTSAFNQYTGGIIKLKRIESCR